MTCKVKIGEVRRFIVDCLKAAGANETPAMQQAELLLQADRTGHQSHGLNRLEKYVHDIKEKICEPNNEPVILRESRSTAWVDARNCMGATSSQFGIDLAMKKAKETGVGWVSMKGANYNGVLGYWAKLCAKKGFIGIALSNTPPILAPTRSKTAALGSNPLAIVAPADDKEFFYLEMSTTAASVGAIEMRRRSGKDIPYGWALGPDGTQTTDPELAVMAGLLMPLGGSETTSGYKGYGLSAAVEVLSGLCAGSNYGHKVPLWGEIKLKNPANLGHTFACVNPDTFAPGFNKRLLECIQHWRSLEPVESHRPVLAPGDIEKKAAEATDQRGALLYFQHQINIYNALAQKLEVKPIEVAVEEKVD